MGKGFYIWQSFTLEEKLFGKLMKERKGRLRHTGGKTALHLIDTLLEKGYRIMRSNESMGGLPISIIVGGEYGMDHKADFYNALLNKDIPYHSSQFYREVQQRKER